MMISNVITKVLEFVVLDKLTSISYADEYQFGFKAKHSTGLCTNVLKRTIDYYTKRGSYVFCRRSFTAGFILESTAATA